MTFQSFNDYLAKTRRKTGIVTNCAIKMHNLARVIANIFFFLFLFLFNFFFSFFFLFCSTSLDDLSKIDSKGWRVVRPWKRAGTLRKVSNFLLLRCHLPVYSHSFQRFSTVSSIKDYAPEIMFVTLLECSEKNPGFKGATKDMYFVFLLLSNFKLTSKHL